MSDTRVSSDSFCRIRLHRNNQDYRLLLSICEMVHRYALPQEHGCGMRFIDFDEKQMWKVFQQFVTNFYRRKQDVYGVNPDAFPWLVTESPEIERFSLPGLNTDIVLTSPSCRIVIDSKFYEAPFDTRYDKPALKSAHLNQMFAYMQNLLRRDERGRQVDGVILYAAVSDGAVAGAFCQDWKLFGHNLRVASLDLSNNWG